MPLHFTETELAARRARTTEALAARGLDGLLMFRQEIMYYLTGYDTFGYVFFQCLYLGADGTLTLLTRAPDLRSARWTSMIEDVRIWEDHPDAQPAAMLRDILDGHRCRGRRLGIEWDAYGLTAANGRKVAAALDGFCDLADASDLVSRQRMVKSAAEIEYVRKAAALADAALIETLPLIRPGAWEGDILATLQGAILRADGDYPANEIVIGSGPAAGVGRYASGRRHLGADDTLLVEFAGVFRHYHACLMRTFRVGAPDPRLGDMFGVALDALAACHAALKPGATVGDVFAAHLRTYEKAGFAAAANRVNACGYGLGTTFAPNWMDTPMVYRDNPVVVEPGMVFFLHMVLTDAPRNVAPGETFLVTEAGSERLGKAPLALAPDGA